jgi:hypothetical protein
MNTGQKINDIIANITDDYENNGVCENNVVQERSA